MGCPIFEPEKIPVTECESRELAIGEPIWVCGRLFTMTCVSMGNPHAVIFVEELTDFPVERFGREEMILTYRGAAMSVFQAARVKPNIKYAIADANTAISMVENGIGISLMPELLLGKRVADVKVMEVSPPAFRVIGLAIPQTKQVNTEVESFADFVVEWVKKRVENK